MNTAQNQVMKELEEARARHAEAERASREAIAAARVTMTPKEALEARQRIQALERQRQADAEANRIRAKIQQRYESIPGADPAEFEDAYPRLLQEYRERVALGDDGTIETAKPYSDPKMWGIG